MGIETWEIVSIFIVIGVIILWKYLGKKGDAEIQEYKDDLKEQGLEVIMADEFIYCGGYDDIGECESSYIKVFNKKLELSFFGVTGEGNFAVQRDINYSDLVGVKIQTQSQIQENPSLGKIFLFGILAFGMKGKTKDIMQNYVVINTKENSIIIKPKGNCMDLVTDINKSIEKFNQEMA